MLVEISLFLVLVTILYFYNKKPNNYPPGFWGLPLIGYVPLNGRSIYDHILEARKTLGDVILWRMGKWNVVFVTDYQKLKKLLSSIDTAERPNIVPVKIFSDSGNYGILGSSGAHWQNIRRFILRQYRDFGMGKSSIIYSMQDEARILVKELEKMDGIPGPIPRALKISVTNVAWLLAANKRYDVNDPKLRQFEQLMEALTSSVTSISFLEFLPWLRKLIPNVIADRTFLSSIRNVRSEMSEFFREIIQDHKNNLDRNDPKDFIDAYLIEMEKCKDDPNSGLCDDDLFETVADLYLGSSETAVETMRYILIYMAAFPKVQQKVQEEIDAVLPGDMLPDETNHNQLHYTRAMVTESHRFASIFPSGVLRLAATDILVDGYRIPKGSILPIPVVACHRDPKYWKNPNEYRPERHLNEKGEFVAPKEGFIPFGVGKRVCAGEAIAKMQLIVFSVVILKSFRFSPPPGGKINIESNRPNALVSPCNHKQTVLIEKRK